MSESVKKSNLENNNDSKLEELVNAWITVAEAEDGSPECEEAFWAYSKVMKMRYEDPDGLWRFILAAYNKPMSDKAVSLFAAEPLEELLSRYGENFIDRLEELAEKDDVFNDFLAGVWKNDMPDGVWNRIQAVRRTEWLK